MPQDIQQNIKVEVTSSGIEGVISSLERLQSTIRSCTSSANSIKTSLNSIGKTSTSGISSMSNAMTKEFKKISMEAVNTKQSVEKTLSSINVSSYGMSGIGTTATAANKKSSSSSGASAELSATDKSAKKASSSLKDLASNFSLAGDKAEDASWNFFRTRAILTAMVFGLAELGSGLVKWYQLASDYAEANHLLYTNLADSMNDVADAEKTAEVQALDLFGNVTGQALKTTEAVATTVQELRDMQEALGIDPTNLNRTFATFYSMANSAGMASSEMAKVSQGMTQLTYDMASLWDMPFAEVSAKLQSALAGNTTAVKSLGLDISRTAADSWLLANGIDANYNSLDRASKMIVIYNMLMERTSAAQGDLARSAMQPANMLRILGEQATIAARNLGGALFPILTQLIPIAVAIANALGKAATALSSFLGIKLGASYTESFDSWNDYMNGLGSSASTASADVASAGASVRSVGDAASSAAAPLSTLSSGLSTADASMLSVSDGAEAAVMSLDNFSSSMEDVSSSASMLSVDEPLNSLTDMSNTIQDISASPLTIDETHAVSPLETVTGAAEDTLDTLNEIKNFQLGFDELHVMPETSQAGGGSGGSGGGGGSGSGGGGGGSGIVAIDPYPMEDTVLEQILKRAEEQLKALAEWIDKVFGEGTWAQIQATVQQVIDSIVSNFGKLMTAIGGLALAIIGLFDWPDLIKGFGDGFSDALTAITDFTTGVLNLITAFLGLEPVKEFFNGLSYEIGYVIGVVAALALTVGGANVAFKILSVLFSPLVGMFKLAISPLTGFVKLLGKIPGAATKASSAVTTATAVSKAAFSGLISAFNGLKTGVTSIKNAFIALPEVINNFVTKLSSPKALIGEFVASLKSAPSSLASVWNSGLLSVVAAVDNFLLKITGVPGVLTKILTPIGDTLINAFGKVGNLFWDVGLKIEQFGGKFTFLKPVIEPVASVLEKVGLRLVGLSNPVTLAINVILLLVDAFTLVYNESEQFRQAVSDVLQGLQDRFNEVKTALEPFFQTFFEAISNLVEKVTGASGPINSFGEAWEAIKSVLVAILEPILTPLIQILGAVGQTLMSVAGIIISVVVTAFTMLIDIISGILTFFGGLVEGITGLGKVVVGFFTGDWNLVGEGIASVAEGFGNMVLGIVEAVTSIIDGPLNWLGDALGIDVPDVSEMATGALRDLGNSLVNEFAPKTAEAAELTETNMADVESSVTDHAANAETNALNSWDALKTGTDTTMSDISSLTDTEWTNVYDDIDSNSTDAAESASSSWQSLLSDTQTKMGEIGSNVNTNWTNLQSDISTMASDAQVAATEQWNTLLTQTSNLMGQIQTQINSIWTQVQTMISTASSQAQSAVGTAWQSMITATNTVLSGISGLVDGIFQQVLSNITNAINACVTAVDNAWTKIQNIMSSIQSAIGGAVSAIGSWVTNAVSAAQRTKANAVSQATKAAQDAASGSKAAPMSVESAAPDMGWYAKGGIFNAPSVIGVGEAGDEAVVPLTGARMRPFAQAIASELRVANSKADVSRTNDSAFINAVSTAVYNAMINGFPSEIKSDVYMDSEKVGKALRKTDRQRGVGTSLVRSV